MAVRIPLPDVDSLPTGVYFHREHPSEKVIILQVPNADRTASETYRIDLYDQAHKSWMTNLKNSQQLTSMLEYTSHLAYAPETGYCVAMQDLDAPSRGETLLKGAHRKVRMGTESLMEQLAIRRRRRGISVPPLMQALQRPRR